MRFADVLHAMDRLMAGPTAPPEGVFLMRVIYQKSGGRKQESGKTDEAGS